VRALSVRQPFAELILRGIKTVEVRSRRTHVRGRVYVYASRTRDNPGDEARVSRKHRIDVDALPRGVLVGTVEIVDCSPLRRPDSKAAGFAITDPAGLFAWHLARPRRAARKLTPAKQPQPVFFNPF